ncbi:helix-turn-helix domain-containing protein [Inmirania thermothiophila]|uniref:Putative Fis-like DNA-binding protein n=1 Tax=Inmirania thermothiophila TaxID=1750597 RepID=A0A3N1XSF8_9GAMM|nr:helix-turn-helix domain-containing protein [Inmirania thermothiophila]ROR29590.1 Fis family transcriptional regulator [Inmirania thermothiophila]
MNAGGAEPAAYPSGEEEEHVLRRCVALALQRYFERLGDTDPADLYDLVIGEVEAPLLEVVMARYGHNQTRAAAVLGMSRSTLRKKLRRHGLAAGGDGEEAG